MTVRTYQALVLRQHEGDTTHAFEQVSLDQLPDRDVLVEVAYSSLNYKDALAVTGAGGVVRRFPMVPGIDLAGRVAESSVHGVEVGDRVLVVGNGIGEEHWGGYAQMARVDGSWLTPVPDELTLDEAMAVGTAGFTAMLAVMALETHGLEKDGTVLVTGAGGGVGGIAIALLANLGYRVTAVTGRGDQLADYLAALGASDVLDRHELARAPKPLESERWAGAIDTVGSQTLATILSQMRYGSSVAACGLAGGMRLETTVFPFILRGVSLLGINSVFCPKTTRQQAWDRIARELPRDRLQAMTRRIAPNEIPALSEAILRGDVRGRLVVDLNG